MSLGCCNTGGIFDVLSRKLARDCPMVTQELRDRWAAKTLNLSTDGQLHLDLFMVTKSSLQPRDEAPSLPEGKQFAIQEFHGTFSGDMNLVRRLQAKGDLTRKTTERSPLSGQRLGEV